MTRRGVADATTVQVVDTPPAAVLYDSATGDAAGWTFSAAGQMITATLAGT